MPHRQHVVFIARLAVCVLYHSTLNCRQIVPVSTHAANWKFTRHQHQATAQPKHWLTTSATQKGTVTVTVRLSRWLLKVDTRSVIGVLLAAQQLHCSTERGVAQRQRTMAVCSRRGALQRVHASSACATMRLPLCLFVVPHVTQISSARLHRALLVD